MQIFVSHLLAHQFSASYLLVQQFIQLRFEFELDFELELKFDSQLNLSLKSKCVKIQNHVGLISSAPPYHSNENIFDNVCFHMLSVIIPDFV